MDDSMPPTVRKVFTIHLIVAIITGLGLLLVPATLSGLFGFPEVEELDPLLRAFGAMLLGFGGLTSMYGMKAKSWERVDYIVRGEITYLALQSLVWVYSLIGGSGPVLGSVLNLILSVALLVLFVAAWNKRPK